MISYIFSSDRYASRFSYIFQVKIALIGITVGAAGLDFSSAQNVVFVELPNSASMMLQV